MLGGAFLGAAVVIGVLVLLVEFVLRVPPAPGPRIAEDGTATFASTFLRLSGPVVSLPPASRPGAGGALAPVGDTLLVLGHDGQIYLVGPDREVRESAIQPPENGFEAYRAAAGRPPYDSYVHDFGSFRYNDIAYVEHAGARSLVISYTRYHPDRECYTNSVSRAGLGSQPVAEASIAPADWQVVFETRPCLPLKTDSRAIEGHTAGGRMVHDGRGTLYLTSGDYAWDGIYGPRSVANGRPSVAQDPDADYGKVIEIDLDSGRAETVSRGNRNAQGIALDGEGRLWVVEHGMRGGDELNLVEPGRNFGWPLESYGTLYSGMPMPDLLAQGSHATFDRPTFAWLPSPAVSALTLVEGFHETWDGDLVAATLKAAKLIRIRVREGRVVFAEDIPIGQRIRHVVQHSSGELVLLTDSRQLIFLGPTESGSALRVVRYILQHRMQVSGAERERLMTALQGCMQCHALSAEDHASAPGLGAVFGARIGSTAFRGYSAAMSAADGSWDRETLLRFLDDPEAVVPGTIMPDPALEPEVARLMVDVLEHLATTIEVPEHFE